MWRQVSNLPMRPASWKLAATFQAAWPAGAARAGGNARSPGPAPASGRGGRRKVGQDLGDARDRDAPRDRMRDYG